VLSRGISCFTEKGEGSAIAVFSKGSKKRYRRNLNPPQYLAVGFLVIIFTGSVILSLPVSWNEGHRVDFLDALFTATSATCVTGLVVVDTADTFNTFGQLVILALIQIGGLGFMTAGVIAALLVGKRITLRNRLVLQESLGQLSMYDLAKVACRIALITFFIELMGAAAIGLIWFKRFGYRAFYLGLFHSVSAFNNAGFDLFGGFQSLSQFSRDIPALLVIMLLVVLGGLGFTVVWDMMHYQKTKKLMFNSRVVLVTTSALLGAGFLGALLIEGGNNATLGSLPWVEKIINALFYSVTPRTAGFSTMDVGQMTPAFLFLLIILMFIGASPGSTGGGIKTTTFATVIRARWCSIKRRKNVTLFKRQIPDEDLSKAETIAFLSLLLVIVTTAVLSITEEAPFLNILFESVSAFGTVGLSMGITPELTAAGKVMLIFTMFAGRLGPLTLAFALSKKSKHLFDYPKGNLSLG